MHSAAIQLALLSLVYSVAGGPQLAQSSTGSTSGTGRVVTSGTDGFAFGSGSQSSGSASSGSSGSASSRFVTGSGSQFGGSGSTGSSGSGSFSSSSRFVTGSGVGSDSGVGSGSGSNSGSGTDSGSGAGSAFGTGSSTGFIQNVGGSVSGSSGSQFVNRGAQFIVNPGQSSQGGRVFADFLQQLTITVTETRTIDNYVTVTESILNSVPVTLTGFNVNTVTLTTFGVHQTDVDDVVALTTTVVDRPVTEFVTTAKSNFIYVTDVSVEMYTITHNAHLISQTVHTTVVTQTLTMSSPVVRTFLTTATETSTEHRTVVNTVFVHGYL
ncbi:uncharacterized protein [Palaemon carinicauda]|uniref:uncharacterized protein n=1 Tax=Palaemon carinicauda TaxID=392227 RepID=UPI0035B69119